jgi:hypothetical protein
MARTRPGDHPTLTAQRRAVLNTRSRRLAYATAGYNLAEGVIAITAGRIIDRAGRIRSGLVRRGVFRTGADLAVPLQAARSRERLALRLIAFSFFALAAWITIDAGRHLIGESEAKPSPAGVALAAASRDRHAGAGVGETPHRSRTRLGH